MEKEKSNTQFDISSIDKKISKESEFIDLLFLEINKKVVGQKKMIERLLIGLLGSGHVLLEGLPGLAKTLAINTLSKTIMVASIEYSSLQIYYHLM